MLHWKLRYALRAMHEQDGTVEVLVALICHSNIRWRCWVGVEYLKDETGQAISVVCKAKEWLLDHKAFYLVPYEHRVGKEKELPPRQHIYQLTGLMEIDGEQIPYLNLNDEAWHEIQDEIALFSAQIDNTSRDETSSHDTSSHEGKGISSKTQGDSTSSRRKHRTPAIKGPFTAKKYYPVNHEKRCLYKKSYTLEQCEPLLEDWEKAGYVAVLGSDLNANPDWLTYENKPIPSKRQAVFDAFAECAWHLPPNFNTSILNGKGGHIGPLVSGFAEFLGMTYNEIADNKPLATKIRHAYKRWCEIKQIDPPKDLATWCGWWTLCEQGTEGQQSEEVNPLKGMILS